MAEISIIVIPPSGERFSHIVQSHHLVRDVIKELIARADRTGEHDLVEVAGAEVLDAGKTVARTGITAGAKFELRPATNFAEEFLDEAVDRVAGDSGGSESRDSQQIATDTDDCEAQSSARGSQAKGVAKSAMPAVAGGTGVSAAVKAVIAVAIAGAGVAAVVVWKPWAKDGGNGPAEAGPLEVSAEPVSMFDGHTKELGYVHQIEFLDGGETIISRGSEVIAWKRNGGKENYVINRRKGNENLPVFLNEFGVRNESPRLTSLGHKRSRPGGPRTHFIHHRNLKDGSIEKEVPLANVQTPYYFHLDPDGRRATLLESRTDVKDRLFVVIRDVTSGKLVRELLSTGPYEGTRTAGFSPDGKSVVAHDKKTVYVFHADDGTERRKWMFPKVKVEACAFHPNGTWLAVVGETSIGNSEIHINDIATGDVLHTIKQPQRSQGVITFSPDGTLMAVAGASVKPRKDRPHINRVEGAITLFEAKTGKQFHEWHIAGDTTVYALKFSPDNKTLAAGGRDRMIRFYQLRK